VAALCNTNRAKGFKLKQTGEMKLSVFNGTCLHISELAEALMTECVKIKVFSNVTPSMLVIV
jgi:hypothetical protein